MFPFCPHCGRSLDQPQIPGQMAVCAHCGQQVGVVPLPAAPKVVDQAEELIRSGTAARCPHCAQLVEVKAQEAVRSLARHFAPATPRRLCPGSGQQVGTTPAAPAAPANPPARKDLSAYMTRDLVRVVSCRAAADPQIEELALEYLDKSDRVRLQVEALREILGADFRMRDYPPALNRPHLAVWGNAASCIVAKRHAQGGYQTMDDAEIGQVLADLNANRRLFFA
jgi:DNA-directed RNA polymerase subunit RPC12/RpoP